MEKSNSLTPTSPRPWAYTYSLISETGSDNTNPIDGKRMKVNMYSPLERAFQNNARHELDSRIGRMFYTDGLSSNFARNPYYCSSYAYATTHSIQGYVPPGYNALKTILL